MAKLTVKANELRDVSVKYVSLVKRGANRIPFRIVKGDTAVMDLSTFFRKSDDRAEAEREAARKSELTNTQAAKVLAKADLTKSEDLVKMLADVLTRAGYEISRKVDMTTGNPAGGPQDDGTGESDQDSPAANSESGGAKDDGNGSDETANPAAGSDAGGPRDNGGDGEGLTFSSDQRSAAKKADKKKADPEDEDEDEDPEDGEENTADDEENEDERKSDKPKKGDKPKKSEEDEDEDEMEKAEKAKKAPKKPPVAAPDAMTKSDETIVAILAKTEAALAAFAKTLNSIVTKTDELKTTVSGIEGKIEKTDRAVAKTSERLAALVPGQAAPDADNRMRKTDNLPPLLDTGFDRF